MRKKKTNKPEWLIKAYHDFDFLNSPQARLIRILSEMIEPQYRFYKNKVKNTVVFFGSARILPRKEAKTRLTAIRKKMEKIKVPSKKLKSDYETAVRDLVMARYYEDAAKLSEKLTIWFKQLEKSGDHFTICTGGGPGIMGAANMGAWKAKGRSVGLNISLPMEQYPNPYQTRELSFEFHYFFIRKFWFFYPAKALVIFPGGYGTFDELFELLTLIQTQKTVKRMPVILYGSEFWDEIIDFDSMVKWGTISRSDLGLFKMIDDVDSAFDYLKEKITEYHIKK